MVVRSTTMNRLAIIVECILVFAVLLYCVLWLRGGSFEPHAATAGALLALVEWIRRRSVPSRAELTVEQRGSGTNENEKEVEYTDSIPLTTQTLSLYFGQGGHTRLLAMRDGCFARAEVQVDWRVVNPYKFLFSTEGHPLDVVVPKFLSRLRGYLEELEMGDARARRREVERQVHEDLSSEFLARGIALESVTIGAIEQMGVPGE